jgi:hypothetical protein
LAGKIWCTAGKQRQKTARRLAGSNSGRHDNRMKAERRPRHAEHTEFRKIWRQPRLHLEKFWAGDCNRITRLRNQRGVSATEVYVLCHTQLLDFTHNCILQLGYRGASSLRQDMFVVLSRGACLTDLCRSGNLQPPSHTMTKSGIDTGLTESASPCI